MLNSLDIELLFSFFILSLVAVFFVSLVILYFTLDRRVKKALMTQYGIQDHLFWFIRIPIYVRSIVFRKLSHRTHPLLTDYNDFDFYQFSSRFEKIVSYISMCSFIILICAAIIANILDFLGYIDLDN